MTFKIISRGIKNIDFNNHQLRCLRSNIYGSMKMYMEITINTSQASQNQHWVNARFKLNAKNNENNQEVYILSFTHSCLVETNEANGEELQRILMIDVPTHELPIIDAYTKAITEGTGYAPFSVGDLDFAKLYDAKTQSINN